MEQSHLSESAFPRYKVPCKLAPSRLDARLESPSLCEAAKRFEVIALANFVENTEFAVRDKTEFDADAKVETELLANEVSVVAVGLAPEQFTVE